MKNGKHKMPNGMMMSNKEMKKTMADKGMMSKREIKKMAKARGYKMSIK